MTVKSLAIAIVALILAHSGAALAEPAARSDKQLVIGVSQFPSTFHPNIDSMMAKTYVLAMTRRPLTAYGPDWTLRCLLCTTLPTLENGLAKRETTANGEPGIAVTYTIAPSATWGDGVPVTTKDVIFTWEIGKHPQSGVASMELYRRITAIDVIGDKTFTMHFDRLTFEYNAINDFALVPAHLDRAIFDADPAQYRNRTTFDTDVTNPGLYFGPYRITKVTRGSQITLQANPTWWGDKPYFNKIIVRTIANTAALEANLLSGTIDMIAGEMGITVDQALAFERRHGESFAITYKPGLIYEHIDLNLNNPILADIRVRKALIMALDRAAISSQLFKGHQPVARSMVNPLDWVYASDLSPYDYAPKAAAKLLDAAGWRNEGGGVRRNAKDEPLRLEIMTTAGNRTRELVEQVLQAQWKALGVDVRIRNQPARVFFGETVSQRKFSAMAMFAWISSPENVPRSTLHSDEIPTISNNWSGQNYTGFRDTEMDSLIDAIEIELDRTKRKALWHRVQEIYLDKLPVIPLYFRANPHILPKRLTGVVPTGHQDPTTLWIESWAFEE